MNTAEVIRFPGPEPGSNEPVISGKGFALIHRQFMDSKLYKDSQAVHLWLHLILKANHSSELVETDIGKLEVKRGEMITGRPTLVSETFIPDNKVKSLLRTFEAKGMIEISSKGRKFSVISILKYDDFQSQICPTDVQRMSNANTSVNATLSDVCPSDVQRLSINNNILNTNVFNTRPGISLPAVQQDKPVRPEAAIQSPKGDKWGTADDLRAAEWMFDTVLTIAPSARKPNFTAWANDIRLMRERDDRTHKDMCSLFRWATQDSFWKGNVLCPSTLREKWVQLEVKRGKQQDGDGGAGRSSLNFNNTDWAQGLTI